MKIILLPINELIPVHLVTRFTVKPYLAEAGILSLVWIVPDLLSYYGHYDICSD